MKKRIIAAAPKNASLSTLGKQLVLLALEIEDAALHAGGKPEIDYTFRDVFGWAVEIYASGHIDGELNRIVDVLASKGESLYDLLNSTLH